MDSARALPDWDWSLAPAIRAYFIKRVGREDSEDLVQEVFLRLQARTISDPVLNQRSYVFQVAAAVLMDDARRKRARAAGAHGELTDRDHPREEHSPERALLLREQLLLTMAALDGLPHRTRQAFLLVRLDGLSYAAAATHMGISVSGVEKHMMRAIERLARAVGEARSGRHA
jgi:RNA polymerase sigma-70 factor (ECF subfamily)